MAQPCLESTTWITLTQNASGQLRADLNPSPRQGNSLVLENDGIFVPGYVAQSSIPVGAQDGDLWRWESPDTPAIQWNFTYSSDAGGWVWHSGSELYDEVTAASTRPQTGSPSYADLAGGSTGPAVTVPFAGLYVAHYGARITAGSDNQGAIMSLTYGATASDADGVRNANQFTASVGRRRMITIGAPGQVVQAKYKNTSSAGGDATFADRFIYLRPLSVS